MSTKLLLLSLLLPLSLQSMWGGSNHGRGSDSTFLNLLATWGDRAPELLRLLEKKLTPEEAQAMKARADADRAESQAKQEEYTSKAQIRAAQERTQQLKWEAERANAQANVETARQARVAEEGEQQRRTAQYTAEEQTRQHAERAKIDHRLAQERQKESDRLARERELDQEWRQADLRREQERREKQAREAEAKAHKERLEREKKANEDRFKQEVEVAKAKAKADAEKEKEMADYKINQWKDGAKRTAMQEMDQAASVLKKDEAKSKIDTYIKGIFDFTDNPERMKRVGIFVSSSVVATAGGVYFFKHALPVVRQAVENWLFTPVLIEETSFSYLPTTFKQKPNHQTLEKLYFNDGMQARVTEISYTLQNTKANNGHYLNYLFYGKPGTGKTATARALAYESGMDFAFMTGGSVADLLKTGKAISRLKEVFDWSKKTKKGMLLFIDEADAFLKDPNGDISQELNMVLKAFLNYTGTESKDFSLILSTNHPQQLAKAVLSRVSYRNQIKFDTPELAERTSITSYFVDTYLVANETIDMNGLAEQAVAHIAEKTSGFAGRDLSYLVLGIEKAVLASKSPILTKATLERVVQESVQGFIESQNYQTFG